MITSFHNLTHIRIFGNSMYPLLLDGDVVYFRKVVFSQIKEDDIIVFRKGNKYITHRVIYKGNRHIVTKGDNIPDSDGRVRSDRIVGRVYKIKRGTIKYPIETLYLLQSGTYLQEIRWLANKLEKSAIRCVFLKGLPLHLYYDLHIPKRIYADCDVLVGESDFEKVGILLKSNGYTYQAQEFTPFHDWLRGGKKSERSYLITRQGLSVIFDVHREPAFLISKLGYINALYPQIRLDQLTDLFLSERRLVRTRDGIYPILSAVHLIVYLALHLMNHNFKGPFRYSLLDRIVRIEQKKDRKMWNKVLVVIDDFQLSSFVFPSFYLLIKYYKTPIPDAFTKQIMGNTRYINNLKKTDILKTEMSMEDRILRFKNLFFLSPVSIWKRWLVFFQPTVVLTFVWLLVERLKHEFSTKY